MIAAVLLVLVLAINRVMAQERWPRLEPARKVWRWIAPRAAQYVRSAPGTYAYLFVLLITTWVLQTSSSRIANQLLLERSTNLHHLSRDPVRVLFASAFWVSSGLELFGWIALFSVVVAPVERWLGTARTATVFFLGHVGATLLTAVGLWLALRADLVESSVANARDVGASYGFFAVAAVLVYRLGGISRRVYATGLVLWVVVDLALSDSFANFGHLAALAIGIACFPISRRRGRGRWTPSEPSRGDAVATLETAGSS
jgi:hypothetical protein